MIRRILYLLTVVVTFYFAGVYQELPLLILFLAEVVLAVAMFVQSRVRTIGMRAKFSKRKMMAYRDRTCRITTDVHYALPLPASRVRFILSVTHDGKSRKIRTDADLKDVKERSGRYEVPLVMEQSGFWTIRLLKTCPQDSLGLFRGRRKGKDEIEIAVRPEISPMRIIREPGGQIPMDRNEKERAARQGESSQEIRELRSYRPGDRIRLVHWPVSAREDQLIVREFEQEDERTTLLFLDFSGSGRMDDTDRERFLTVMDALLQGLIKSGLPVDVTWRAKDQMYRVFVQNQKGLEDAIWRFDHFPPEDAERPSGTYTAGAADQRLTWDARWYAAGRLLWSFSKSGYKEEIETKSFSFFA